MLVIRRSTPAATFFSLTYLLVCLLLAPPPLAAQPNGIIFSSGTGFFISRQGDIVTNAHVVDDCANSDAIYISGAGMHEPRQARLKAMNEGKDLALLDTTYRPGRIPKLRFRYAKATEQTKVFLMGYPKAKTYVSNYETGTATIESLEGPGGEKEWLQFTSTASQGNSGGPLLDFAGNIVGVVTAKTRFFEVDPTTKRRRVVGYSDIAVQANILRDFLDYHRIQYKENDAVLTLSQNRLENMASDYVVHVFCANNYSGKLSLR